MTSQMDLQILYVRVLELLSDVEFVSAKWDVYAEEERERLIIERRWSQTRIGMDFHLKREVKSEEEVSEDVVDHTLRENVDVPANVRSTPSSFRRTRRRTFEIGADPIEYPTLVGKKRRCTVDVDAFNDDEICHSLTLDVTERNDPKRDTAPIARLGGDGGKNDTSSKHSLDDLSVRTGRRSRPRGRRRRDCPHCSKEFAKSYNLQYHVDNAHGDLIDPAMRNQICDACGETFSSKGSLYIHRVSRHKKKRVYPKKEGVSEEVIVCHVCGRDFSSNPSYLKLHLKMVHSGLKWSCDCGKSYASQSMLKRHVESIHKGIRHNCPHCDKTFSVKSTLKVHLDAVHRGIKHACPICHQSFAQLGDMRIHVKAVHDGCKSKCDICGKEFNRAPEMRRHQKAVHKTTPSDARPRLDDPIYQNPVEFGFESLSPQEQQPSRPQLTTPTGPPKPP